MAKASKGKAREQPQPESVGSGQGGLGLGMEERVTSISSEEINVLIYCYLLESPFPHSAYTFRNEAQLDSAQYAHLRDSPDGLDKQDYAGLVPRGELIRYLQKGLLWSDAEKHVGENNEIISCKSPYHLLKPHTCSVSTPDQSAFLSPSFALDELPPQRPAIFEAPVAGPSNTRNTPKANGASRKGKGKEVAPDNVASTSTSTNGTPKVKPKVVSQDDADVEMADGDATAPAKKRQRPPAVLSPDKETSNKRDDTNGSAKGKPKSAGAASTSSNAASPLPTSEKSFKPKSSDRERDRDSASDVPKKKRKVDEGRIEKDSKKKDKERDDVKVSKAPSVTSEPGASRKASAASDITTTSKKSTKTKSLIEIKKERKEAGEKGIGIWREHTGQVVCSAWNPKNPEMIATGGGDATARIWEFDAPLSPSSNVMQLKESPIVMRHLPTEKGFKDVTGVAWHPDGMMLATSSLDNVARLYMSSGELHIALTLHSGPINVLKWNEVGSHLLTASNDSTVCLWELAAELNNSKNRVLFTSHSQQVHDVDWLDNEVFASGSEDSTIYVHRITSTTPIRTFKGHEDEVFAVRWSPARPGAKSSSRLLASASDDGTARIWGFSDREASPSKEEGDDIKVANGKTSKYCKQVLTGHTKGVTAVEWSPNAGKDGERMIVATASYDFTSRLYDALTGECLHVFAAHDDGLTALVFSPKGLGHLLATGAWDGRVVIWNTQTGEQVKLYELCEQAINHISWRDDGEQLAVAAADKTLRTLYVGDLLAPLG